jgi:hypothetical protein
MLVVCFALRYLFFIALPENIVCDGEGYRGWQ